MLINFTVLLNGSIEGSVAVNRKGGMISDQPDVIHCPESFERT